MNSSINNIFGGEAPYGPNTNIATKLLYSKLQEEFNLTPFDALFNMQKYVEVYAKPGLNVSMAWNDDDMSIKMDISKDYDNLLYVNIDWHTTSGHHVVIKQVLHDDNTIEISAEIGTDPSEYFYNIIVEIFNELNISVSYID